MPLHFLLFLAILQGITEFLPVSSSAHLILAPRLLGFQDQGYEIDLAVHFGTLLAVIIYFRRDVLELIMGGIDTLRGKFKTDRARFFWLMVIATIPVMFFGAILEFSGAMDHLRNPKIIAFTMIFFGLVLYYADKKFPQKRIAAEWNLKDAIIMGLWQAVALIPGTSRSGATVTASRFLGFNRHDGAKIAMLMSIPTILAAATLEIISSVNEGALTRELSINILIGVLASFIAALITLSLMMKFLKSTSYTPYVIYRIFLGILLFIYL